MVLEHQRRHSDLTALISELEALIPMQAIVKTTVSEASVGWHVEHCTLVINGILSSLIKSDPQTYRWKWSLPRAVIFTRGKIPRGRGRAPKNVFPELSFEEDKVHSLLANIRSYLPKLEELSQRHYFKHPLFGQLNKKRTLYFIQLHTRHHLAIIHEILKAG